MTTLTPMEARLRSAIEELMAALTQEQREECILLANLDPAGPGCQVRFIGETDVLEVLWSGASIGILSGAWLETGEVPDPWPPAWYDTGESE